MGYGWGVDGKGEVGKEGFERWVLVMGLNFSHMYRIVIDFLIFKKTAVEFF